MIAVPAVDLREGRCVQLVGGKPEDERVSLPDPVAQALHWWEMGFRHLHIVDLDAALSLGNNRDTIARILAASHATIQVGGGVRDEESVRWLVDAGVSRVIIGTRAIEEPQWLEPLSLAYPEQLVVAADIKNGMVLKKGWTESTGLPVLEFLRTLNPLPLAGILCTDVGREGRMEGSDIPMAQSVVMESRHPVWISGGITGMDELRALARAGARGVVLGMAIYTGVLPPDEVAKEFGA